MRYAIISDIHSNLEAFSAVIEDIQQKNIDKICCLGDIVGYGANPNECMEKIISLNIIYIQGNHDQAVCDLMDTQYYNPLAKEAIDWTKKQLEATYVEKLKQASKTKIVDNLFLIVHGSVFDTNEYLLSNSQAIASINFVKSNLENIKIVFYGHTHQKMIYGGLGNIFDRLQKEYFLSQNSVYLINPGSVGQPRDRDKRASYVIFDTSDYSIKYQLLEYDIEKAKNKIIKCGLPEELAIRLSFGI